MGNIHQGKSLKEVLLEKNAEGIKPVSLKIHFVDNLGLAAGQLEKVIGRKVSSEPHDEIFETEDIEKICRIIEAISFTGDKESKVGIGHWIATAEITFSDGKKIAVNEHFELILE